MKPKSDILWSGLGPASQPKSLVCFWLRHPNEMTRDVKLVYFGKWLSKIVQSLSFSHAPSRKPTLFFNECACVCTPRFISDFWGKMNGLLVYPCNSPKYFRKAVNHRKCRQTENSLRELSRRPPPGRKHSVHISVKVTSVWCPSTGWSVWSWTRVCWHKIMGSTTVSVPHNTTQRST